MDSQAFSIPRVRPIQIGNYSISYNSPLTIICGPCVIESRQHAIESAAFLVELMSQYPVQFIYKSSYDKANRSSNKRPFPYQFLQMSILLMRPIRLQQCAIVFRFPPFSAVRLILFLLLVMLHKNLDDVLM